LLWHLLITAGSSGEGKFFGSKETWKYLQNEEMSWLGAGGSCL
jgi:hypothetical protein